MDCKVVKGLLLSIELLAYEARRALENGDSKSVDLMVDGIESDIASIRQEHASLTLMDATKIAVPRKFTKNELELAKSLAPYCSGDDVDLDRRTFLEYVRDRIDQDLMTSEY